MIRFCVFLCLLFLAFPACAATLQGVVRDPSGLVIAGAQVTATNAATSEAKSTKTDGQGRFSIDGLGPGVYKLEVSQQGFETDARTLTIGDQPKLDVEVQLKIQAQETTVDVSGKRSALANADPNYRALRDSGIHEVIRLENVTIQRDAGTVLFRSGVIGFLPPVLGRVAIGVFVGQGSLHLAPAMPLEENYLQMLTENKTFDEEFDNVVVCFTDDTYSELKHMGTAVPATPALDSALRDFRRHMHHRTENPRSMLEYMLADANIPNVEVELLSELYNPKGGASFSAYIHGRRYRDLRFLMQPRGAMRHLPSPEEVALIHLDPGGEREGIFYLTHYASEWKNGSASSAEDKRIVALKHYRIETVISRNSRLTASAEVTFEARRDGDRILDFGLLPNLRVTRVTIGNKETAFVQEDRKDDGSFYAILPQPTVKGESYALTIEYEGNKVITNEGSGSFSVGARTSWYPSVNAFCDRATFDLTFKIPKQYTVVGVGKLVKQWREADFAASQWVSDAPLAVAGFNYGDYKKKQRDDPESKYSFEAYATSEVPGYLRGAGLGNMAPSAMADSAIVDSMNSIRLFEHWFGPLPYGRIAVTQQPEFNFGQSWPTLVYLPVSAFLDSTQRWSLLGGNAFRFADFIQEVTPHEVSHQWWGHLVGWATYHDQWISEGFADFSASLFLQFTEKKPDKYNEFWERARKAITEKNQFGFAANDAGPLWMGLRLNTFRTGRAYQKLVYPKGAYILQMLRQLMWSAKTGDQDFLAMMQDFVKSYTNKNASTEDFREVVNRHMKPDLDLQHNGRADWFFREWVYGSEIPRYHFEYSLAPGDQGKVMLTGKVTQSGVSTNFVMPVPVYADFDGNIVRLGSVALQGNQTSKEFKVMLPKKPKRLLVNAHHDVLAAENTVSGN